MKQGTYIRTEEHRERMSLALKQGNRFKNMAGQRFGRILVVERDGTHLKNRVAVWRCKCDCGQVTFVRGTSLRQGTTKSCGCLSKEMTSKRTRLPKGEANFNSLYYCYIRNAKKRGWSFDLSRTFFRHLVTQSCYYCGEYPSNNFRGNKNMNGTFVYNGIDRVQNEMGYVPDNVVTCCKRCNRVKATFSVSDFVGYCKKVVNCNEKRKVNKCSSVSVLV